MVGLGGVIGTSEHGLASLKSGLATADDQRHTTYENGDIEVCVCSHPQFHEDQPAPTKDGSLLWVHGDLFGFDGPDGYVPRTNYATPDAEYCADLYDTHGMDFVAGLNGEFAGVIADPRTGAARLFTDRLGSRPLFYTRTDSACLFASRIQPLGLHPEVTPAFDVEYLTEFFGIHKALGTATPLAGISKVPPASVVSVGAADGLVHDRTYWRPEYTPVERPPGALTERLVETLTAVFNERLRDDLEYGVLLSGGADSRLVLACLRKCGRDPIAFHMTNWPSRETRTTARVARAADTELRILRRERDYHANLLDRAPGIWNFAGVFDEMFATGFADALSAVDVLLTGYLGDTNFGAYPIHLRQAPLGVRSLPLPFERPVRSVSEYIDRYCDKYDPPATVPTFLDVPAGLKSVWMENVHIDDGAIRNHGVAYPSLRELQLCEYYPLTNQFASANTDSLRQIAGHWTPFFDRRLLDLHLTVPVKTRVRHNPVNHALTRLSPALARLPRARTGVPIDRSSWVSPGYLVHRGWAAVKRRIVEDAPPAPYLNHGPFMDESEVIRQHGIIAAAIERNEEVIASLPFLDREGIERCYQEHLSGDDHWRSLYALVTLLEAPVTERIAQKPSAGD